MTEEELLAARAKRTGRKQPGVPLEQSGAATGRFPGQDEDGRSPLDGFGGEDLPEGQHQQPPAQRPALPESDLQNQLNAAMGRLQPMQQQLADREAALAAMQHQIAEMNAKVAQYEMAEREAKARQAADEFDPFSGLDADELDMLDPITRNTIKAATRSAIAAVNARYRDPEEVVRKTMEEQDKQRRTALIQTTNQDLGLVELSRDKEFEAFIEGDDSAGLLLSQYLNAPDARSAELLIPRVRSMVKRYQSSVKNPSNPRTPDPADALASHARRGSNRPSENGGTRTAQLTPAQAKEVRLKATAAIRAGRKEEANSLLQQLI